VRATTTYLLTAVHRAHLAALGPRLSALGLQPGALLALAEIAHDEGLTQTDLARGLAVKPPTVTKLLRGLERNGMTERRADPDDARVARVHLTGDGRRTLRVAKRAWAEAEAELLAGLTDEERAVLHRLLDRAARRASG
jgi:DNA-binding MarR family transcriptional regulator